MSVMMTIVVFNYSDHNIACRIIVFVSTKYYTIMFTVICIVCIMYVHIYLRNKIGGMYIHVCMYT